MLIIADADSGIGRAARDEVGDAAQQLLGVGLASVAGTEAATAGRLLELVELLVLDRRLGLVAAAVVALGLAVVVVGELAGGHGASSHRSDHSSRARVGDP